MQDYYENMREHLDRHEQSRVRGLSTRDVVAQSYSDAELRQLIASLRGGAPSADAAFRLSSFIWEQQQDRIPEELRRSAADAVADCVASSGQRLDTAAAEMFIVWGAHRPDHSHVCMALLRHPEAWIRRMALSYAGSFLPAAELSTLFEFQRDPYISEIAMGGPLRYSLRDDALRVLERLTHCPVADGGDCFEDTPDGRISYRSWSPFLGWYESHKRQFTAA